MILNTIFTDEEYMAQGFTAEEVPMARRSDELFNCRDVWTEEEEEEYHKLVIMLGL